MSQIPLSALAGVLMVTAWRMNEWEAIHTIFGRRFKTAMVTFTVTLLATITFDLTQAILIGVFLSGLVYLSQSANIEIDVQEIDPEKLRQRGIENAGRCRHVKVAYLTGPLFFAATGNFNEAFARVDNTHALILSMRAVPLIDTSGLEAMAALHKRLQAAGGSLMLAAVNDKVRAYLDRGGMTELIGGHNIFWSADQAIVAAEAMGCPHCQAELLASGQEMPTRVGEADSLVLPPRPQTP
jgi:SulP family sulfate permease